MNCFGNKLKPRTEKNAHNNEEFVQIPFFQKEQSNDFEENSEKF